jgi:unsaturated chondroitin disaccharide hydrolase
MLTRGETADTHDLGFLHGRPALACDCRPDRTVRAAAHMAAMVQRSPAGMLPTMERRCSDCPPGRRETIIDSLPNVELLTWSGRRDLAVAHARRVVAALVRPDGSTAQAVQFDARTGALGAVHTHQGASADSTWARGQAWALYGLAALSSDPELHAAAERVAGYLHARLATGLPRWDLDASEGPTDASAAAVIAAGLARLAEAGEGERAARHRALARALLERIDATVSGLPPIGRFAGQVYTYGGSDWDEDAEFVLGIDFALEAIARLG